MPEVIDAAYQPPGQRTLPHFIAFYHISSKTETSLQVEIKGPDNPTSQLLPIMSQKCCSGDREGRKDKGGGGGKMV
jgi:hypothetical protein